MATVTTTTQTLSVHTLEGQKCMTYDCWYTNPRAPIVVCVHGLTRNRHDFDAIARVLAERYCVYTVDILGRGDSDWMQSAEQYGYPLYVQQMQQFITHILSCSGHHQIAWLGTSMGGLIGMMMAAAPLSPIRYLIMNDVGPVIPLAALQRLSQYVGLADDFANLDEVERYLRRVAKPFGPLTDEQWRFLAEHGVERDGERWLLKYDPDIAQPLVGLNSDVDLTAIWLAVVCDVFVLHGQDSDLLSAQQVQQMRQRPRTDSVTFAGVGHAPMLMADEQIDAVCAYLNARF